MSETVAPDLAIPLQTLPPKSLPAEIDRIRRYRNNCWSFATEAVWTLDEVDKLTPIKQFPAKEHLEILIHHIVNEKLLALVKHRRMMATWSCCVVAVWEVMFFEGRTVAIISKKEEDSDALVEKCKFIYDNIPENIIPKSLRPRITKKYTEMNNHDLGSKIKGFAQGPDQLRQHTISRIIADEIGFWEQAEQTWVGMKPTLEGGGSVCILSTRFPGFFQQIIEDTIDE